MLMYANGEFDYLLAKVLDSAGISFTNDSKDAYLALYVAVAGIGWTKKIKYEVLPSNGFLQTKRIKKECSSEQK